MNRFDIQHLLFFSVMLLLGAVHFEQLGLLYDCSPLFTLDMTLLVTLSTMLLLSGAGFFHPIRPYPRKSDSIIMLCIVPVSGIASLLILAALFPAMQLVTYESLIVACVSLSCATFACYYIFSRFVGRACRRKQVVLCLPPLQAVRFIQNLAQIGFAEYLDFHSFDHYRKRDASADKDDRTSLLVWSNEGAHDEQDSSRLLKTHLGGVPVMNGHAILETLRGRVSLDTFTIWEYLNEARSQTDAVQIFWRCKGIVEPFIAFALLLLLSPLFLVVALCVKLESRGPVIFSQRRVGLLGKEFVLYKFRSMRLDAEKEGPKWASKQDDRVTLIGKILRKTRIDELPQLVNVMKGEMSFCGPRPERPEMYRQLAPAIEHFWLRTLVKPGITGWAQIQAGYAATVAESRLKLEFDLYYIKHMSPRLDLIILLHTVMYILGCHAPRAEEDKATQFDLSVDESLNRSFRYQTPTASFGSVLPPRFSEPKEQEAA